MLNHGGTRPAGKGSGANRRRGTRGIGKTGGSGCIYTCVSGSEKSKTENDGKGRNRSSRKKPNANHGSKERFENKSEFTNADWWK